MPSVDYRDMSVLDLLADMHATMTRGDVPPLDLVVRLMGFGIDVEAVMESITRREDY
jgi:hypothetical protein